MKYYTPKTRAGRHDERVKRAKPYALFDAVKKELCIISDAMLAERLLFPYCVISAVRCRRVNLNDNIILSIHEETGWPISKIRDLHAQS